jgi:transcriptional regulator with XRE-family HTH domain
MVKPVAGLAARVQALRAGAGLSQQALATAAGLSISVVRQVEQGTNMDPRGSTLKAIAGALGTTVDELLRDDAGGTSKPAEPPPAKKMGRGKK